MDEVRRIERTTPFIKSGELLDAESIQEEKLLADMTLKDLKFDSAKSIGKGSYGIVQLATHIPSGIRVAVKKIDKSTLTSARIRETLKREI